MSLNIKKRIISSVLHYVLCTMVCAIYANKVLLSVNFHLFYEHNFPWTIFTVFTKCSKNTKFFYLSCNWHSFNIFYMILQTTTWPYFKVECSLKWLIELKSLNVIDIDFSKTLVINLNYVLKHRNHNSLCSGVLLLINKFKLN